MTKTVPLVGKTPGKASRARAEERQRFDRAVQSRVDQRDRERREFDKKRLDEEDREYAARRRETVIRANPVPAMYSKRL